MSGSRIALEKAVWGLCEIKRENEIRQCCDTGRAGFQERVDFRWFKNSRTPQLRYWRDFRKNGCAMAGFRLKPLTWRQLGSASICCKAGVPSRCDLYEDSKGLAANIAAKLCTNSGTWKRRKEENLKWLVTMLCDLISTKIQNGNGRLQFCLKMSQEIFQEWSSSISHLSAFVLPT